MTRRRTRSSRASIRTRTWPRYLLVAVVLLALIGALVWYQSQIARQLPNPSQSGELRSLGTVQAPDYHSLAFDPREANTLLFGNHNGIMRSTDGGRSWDPVVNRPNFDAMNLAVHPQSPDVVWMAGHNVFYRSADGGKTWDEARTRLPGLDLHAFTVGATNPQVLYAFAVGYGLFRSPDNGDTWESLTNTAPPGVIALAAGGDPEVLYVGTQQGMVLSQDGGASFSAPISVGAGGPIVAIGAVPGSARAYAATEGGLYVSEDAGQTWRDAGYRGAVAAVAVHPADPTRVALIDPKGRVFGTE